MKLPGSGFLRVDAHLTRTGVFVYRNADGTERREYRPPGEVFNADALGSFAMAPLTDEHPPGYLTTQNARHYMRGTVGDLKRDGDYVRASLLVMDSELVAKLETGEARQVSCGYRCDLEMTAGVSPEGENFDAIQRDIVGNHVAIVEIGRAGPGAAVRMDASDLAVLLDQESGGADPAPESSTSRNDEVTVKHTIKIGGISFGTEDATLAQAFEKFDGDSKSELEKALKLAAENKANADKVQAKLDAEIEAHGKTKVELKELPEKVRADALSRLALESSALSVLGDDAKLDGLKDDEVRAKVLAKLSPELKLAGKSTDYIGARYDAAIEAFEAKADESDEADEDDAPVKPTKSAKLRADTAVEQDDEDDGEKVEKFDVQASFDAMRERNRKMAERRVDGEAAEE